jgi:hypothetical protein
MACKARRLGEDLQAQLDHNVLRHHQPSTSSFENHTAAPYGSLLDPFSTRCRRLFLGPDGCSHRSRLTRKLTAPLCASRTHLAAFPASPGVTTFTRQIEVSPRTPFRDCVRHGTRMCDIAARRADTWVAVTARQYSDFEVLPLARSVTEYQNYVSSVHSKHA